MVVLRLQPALPKFGRMRCRSVFLCNMRSACGVVGAYPIPVPRTQLIIEFSRGAEHVVLWLTYLVTGVVAGMSPNSSQGSTFF